MGILDRTQRAIKAFRRSAPDLKQLEKQLDVIGNTGMLPEELKAIKDGTASKLDIRRVDHNLAYASVYNSLRKWVSGSGDEMPAYGGIDQDQFLSEFWMKEPILAGAVYSLVAKMTALPWVVSGKRNLSSEVARMLATAAHIDGYDWGGFISSTAQDYYTTNNGVFWETAKQGSPTTGRMVEIGHIDSLTCTLTGNKEKPMVYSSDVTGQIIEFRPGEYIHFTSMPSPREMWLGKGYCFVNRAYRAAKLLMGLHNYDDEKLNNLPPEGVAAVTGLTIEEFTDAVALWQAQRHRDNSLTFPQVLWLIGSQPQTEVKLDFVGFSQIPESFDRNTVVEQYVAQLALAAGVDAREFWPISSGALGTAGDAEIQHMKAKGKGTGEFISTVERHVNGELPEGVDYECDTQDIEEDANAAAVAKAWIDAFFPLYNLAPKQKESNSNGQAPTEEKANPRPDKPNGAPTLPTTPIPGANTGRDMTNSGKGANQFTGGGFPAPGADKPEQVITKDDFITLLIEKNVLPEWFANSKRVSIRDSEIHINKELYGMDATRYRYHNGILKEIGLPAINLYTPPSTFSERQVTVSGTEEDGRVLAWLREKEDELLASKRNIVGDPIPDREALRGTNVTKATVRDEIARWRLNPILSPYAPTDEELETIYANIKPQ